VVDTNTAEAYSSEVATEWFELQIDMAKDPGYSPPVVARVFGYSGVALYEAVLSGRWGYVSILDEMGFPDVVPKADPSKEYNLEIVANKTLAEITRGMFPNTSVQKKEKINRLEEQISQTVTESNTEVIQNSINRGKEVAEAILAFAATDGGDRGFEKNFPSTYEPPVGAGMWVSTPPRYQRALLPYWGDNRYFVSESGNCNLKGHPAFSTEQESDFYKEAYEVYETGLSRTEEEIKIALFWADDPGKTSTPPGHWISIVNGILQDGDYSLADAAEIYAKLGIALSDSFVSCWKEKYEYNLIRPITYIQENIDSTWNTPKVTDPVITPPFPEYPSGHSVQSGAAAAVLTDFFGENFRFVDHTHEKLGYEARAFNSFMEAAQEAAISRLYGGIHYRFAIENGIDLGICIGEQVNNLKLK